MTIASWGFAPALAAGNAVVLKPAELTPLTAIRLGELGARGGAARGPVRRGDRVGLGRRPAVRVAPRRAQGRLHRLDRGRHRGRGRAARGGSSRSRSSSAARAPTSSSPTPTSRRRRPPAPGAVFDNAGQDCCARSRILVQRSVYDRFLELLEPAVPAWRVGDPTLEDDRDGTADLGIPPLDASQASSTAPTSPSAARRPTGDGFWFAPTVVLADRGDRIAQRGGLRPRRRGAAVRRRGRRHRASRTTRSTGSPARSGPRTSAARSGCRAASRAACCR